MKSVKKTFVVLTALLVFFGVAFTASAQTTSTSTSALVNQIQNLLKQIADLQSQMQALQTQRNQLSSELRETLQLTRNLSLGMTDEEVRDLQEILSLDDDVYPEGLVTGYFGPLTEKAVKKFQQKYGIEQLGVVGPKTRTAIHAFWKNMSNASGTPALPPGLAKKANVQNQYQSSTTAYTVKDHKIAVCHKGKTITIALSALTAHLAHGDSTIPCGSRSDDDDDDDDSDDDDKDTTAPTLSNISISTGSTTASISWNTNENAKSSLWYSTSTPVSATAQKETNTTLKTSHSFSLSGLTATTTYHYIISVTDSSGNTATSSENSFVTTE